MSRRREREELSTEWEDVEELPYPRRVRIPKYDELIDEFIQSNKRFRKLIVRGKHIKTVYQALVKRIKKRNLPIRLHLIRNELYFERIQE